MARRNWEDIPESTWDEPKFHFHEDDRIELEIDYTGFNGRQYHDPPTVIDFDQFLNIYEQL
jgi:hypothetical protein